MSVQFQDHVVPLAGTWIETLMALLVLLWNSVVPLAGTWIETKCQILSRNVLGSFPLRERGLKHVVTNTDIQHARVVPLAGTWIETRERQTKQTS